MNSRQKATVIGCAIDALSWAEVIQRITDWGTRGESRYVCLCNVHSVVTARRNASLGSALANADLATPDGAPIAWVLRHQGFPDQTRIAGPDLMVHLCAIAAEKRLRVFLLGGKPEVLVDLERRLRSEHSELNISGSYSPPFRPLTLEEDAEIVACINDSGAQIVFVGLGCPTQELWMAAHRGQIKSVMLGVGAAFDFHSGRLQRAPLWVRNRGFEWLHRLYMDPIRLWRRYLVTNTMFVVLVAWEFATKVLKHR